MHNHWFYFKFKINASGACLGWVAWRFKCGFQNPFWHVDNLNCATHCLWNWKCIGGSQNSEKRWNNFSSHSRRWTRLVILLITIDYQNNTYIYFDFQKRKINYFTFPPLEINNIQFLRNYYNFLLFQNNLKELILELQYIIKRYLTTLFVTDSAALLACVMQSTRASRSFTLRGFQKIFFGVIAGNEIFLAEEKNLKTAHNIYEIQ